MENVFQCESCQKKFTQKSNLKRHLKIKHASSEKLFSCDLCCFKTSTHFSLNRHKYNKHTKPNVQSNAKAVYCPLCKCTKATKNEMKIHYSEIHNIRIEDQNITFKSENDFNTWKSEIEKIHGSQFVKKQSKYISKIDESTKLHFVCHRDGLFKSASNFKRRLKLLGSNKINGYCPARIDATIHLSGQVEVNCCLNHVGHQSDIGRFKLTAEEKKVIADKIALKIPFDKILDDIRSSISGSDIERQHLVNRKDLFNIEQQFKLRSEAVRHSNDYVSVESWINEMESTGGVVRFYKAQGDILETNNELKTDDFILIIMNDAQIEMLNQFGKNCVCLDSTHGLNNYGFQLTTLLVLDDLMQGFPCSFMFSNRCDTHIIEIFLTVIRDSLGKVLQPRLFMSDMAEEFFNAWIRIMSQPEYHLFCTWHVDRAWRKNLSKITSREKRAEIYKVLRTLLQETDKQAFHSMLVKSISLMKSETDCKIFGEYFEREYEGSASKWAYCYRLHAGLNTNMHLERMHGVIKHIYMHGKKPKRLDIAIHVLMRFIRDKLFDRLIYLNKGKISSKLALVRQRHDRSLMMSSENIVSTEKPWTVLSSNKKELYEIKETDQLDCNCNLRCSECKACIHSYICSCSDSSIKFNMCKHIHLCIMKLCKTANPITTENEENNLFIEETANQIEKDSLLNELRNPMLTKKNSDFNKIKEKLWMQFNDILEKAQTEEDLAIVSRFMQPILPTMRAEKRKNELISTNCPSTSRSVKFEHQRRFSLKKNSTNRTKTSIVKPSIEETEKITAHLLLTNESADLDNNEN